MEKTRSQLAYEVFYNHPLTGITEVQQATGLSWQSLVTLRSNARRKLRDEGKGPAKYYRAPQRLSEEVKKARAAQMLAARAAKAIQHQEALAAGLRKDVEDGALTYLERYEQARSLFIEDTARSAREVADQLNLPLDAMYNLRLRTRKRLEARQLERAQTQGIMGALPALEIDKLLARPLIPENSVMPNPIKPIQPVQPSNALAKQVGGSHYNKLKIQPAEYSFANNLSHMEGDAIAYITRWRDKGGVEDLQKAIHCLELVIDLHARYG